MDDTQLNTVVVTKYYKEKPLDSTLQWSMLEGGKMLGERFSDVSFYRTTQVKDHLKGYLVGHHFIVGGDE